MSDIKRIIREGDTVSLFYVGKLDTGEVFDSNIGSQPFTLKVGSGTTIIGFEEALIGMAEGEEKTFRVAPERGYGHYHDKLVYVVPRSHLGEVDPVVGTELLLRSNKNKGSTAKARITKISGDKVTLDMNHALSGKNLTFTVRIAEIK